ncbi:MAG: hypothetical protein ACNA8R_02180 [Nitriliruptoraceae bacterium]
MARRGPFAGWPPGSGLAIGLVVGMLVGVGVGRLLELRALGFVGGLALGVVLGLLLDNEGPAVDGDQGGSDAGEDGSIARALLWLGLGAVLLIAAVLATAPELLRSPGQLSQLLVLVLAAGIPGTLLLLAMIARRRRIDRMERGGSR